MLAIHYPEPVFQIKKEAGKDMIFDPLAEKMAVAYTGRMGKAKFCAVSYPGKKISGLFDCYGKNDKTGRIEKTV